MPSVVTEQSPKRTRVNKALAVQLMAAGQTADQVAPKVGAKSGNSLRVGLHKQGVTKRSINQAIINNIAPDVNQALALRVVNQASEVLRMDVHGIVQHQVNKLKGEPDEYNIQQVKALGEALEPLARIGDKLHGWGNKESAGSVQIASFTQYVDGPNACGSDATTSSVPIDIQSEPIPQVEQSPKTEIDAK